MRLWNRRLGMIHPEVWLVSSRELERRTAHQRDVDYYTLEAHLDPSEDRWADCRYPAKDLAAVPRTALTQLQLAA